MFHFPKNALGLTLCLLLLALPGQALAFDAGVRAPVLADPMPGAVSVPFEIPVKQSAAVPQPLNFQIAVEGFTLDPDPVADRRIGSFDMVTDSGDFDDTEIRSNGPGENGVRTWTLDWGLGKPLVATVKDDLGLDVSGSPVADPDSTLISFTLPGNYHGFRLLGLSLRFNQERRGRVTEGVGAVNPSQPGRYLVRSRIESVAPESEVALASALVRVGQPLPRTALHVKANRLRTQPGGRVKFTLRTTNGTRDRVTVTIGQRRLRVIWIGPEARSFFWRPGRSLRGRRVAFAFKPDDGPARKLSLRVAR